MSDNSNPAGASARPRVSLFGRKAPKKAAEPASPPPPEKPKRRRRGGGLSTLSAFLSFVLVGVFIGLAVFVVALVEVRKAGPLAQDKVVEITREDDGGPIAEQLERAGIIDSAVAFSAMTLFDSTRGALKRGEYAFKAGISLREVEQELLSGKVVLHSITIPEGLTSDQIVQRLRENDILTGDVKEIPREGSLLPETYKFARGESRQALLTVMAKAQTKVVEDIWQRRAEGLPVKSPGELVTLASIVEKETGKTEERPRVAGVFVNRLQTHMKLQSDPTIVYGLVFGKGTLGHSITRAELQQSTPYNTYIVDGLPPGPICNPGKAAMEAVANPAHGHDLYFVADGTGGHAFAETLDQHLTNVAHWRQIEQDAKDKLSPDAASPGAAPPPTAAPLKKSELDPQQIRAAFGALAPPDAAAPAKGKTATLSAKLVKMAASARKRDALLANNGALSPANIASQTLDNVNAVVLGVNDQSLDAVPAPAAAPGAPLPQAYAAAPQPSPAVNAVARVATGGRGLAFDASEGTPLDPLLNKTYDLSYAKTIPPQLK